MSGELQRRLEAAQEARRQAALREVPAFKPESLGDGTVLDLRTVLSVREMATKHRTADGSGGRVTTLPRTTRAGLPSRKARSADQEHVPTTTPAQDRCPECGGDVRLDLFDTIGAVAHMSCIDCGHLFTARSPRA